MAVYLLQNGSPPGTVSGRLRYYTVESAATDAGAAGEEAPRYLLGREESLEAVLLAEAERSGETITTAESCTGGSLGAALTEIPGSSAAYLGGVVSYSYEMKERLLGVGRELLDSHGAVSPECAAAMAAGARARLGGTLQIAITGIAGPGGGTPTKPVGLVCMGRISRSGSALYEFRFPGDRREVRERSVEAALLLLLDALRKGDDALPEAIGAKRLTVG